MVQDSQESVLFGTPHNPTTSTTSTTPHSTTSTTNEVMVQDSQESVLFGSPLRVTASSDHLRRRGTRGKVREHARHRSFFGGSEGGGSIGVRRGGGHLRSRSAEDVGMG